MLRILHVIGSLDLKQGGPVRAVIELSRTTTKESIHSDILTFGLVDRSRIPLENSQVHVLPTRYLHQYGYAPGLGEWLRENLLMYDGVVLHGLWQYHNVAVAKACRRASVPYVCFPHGMLEPWSVLRQGVRKLIKKWIYWHLEEGAVFAGAQRILLTTRRELYLTQQMFNLHTAMCVVIPYGIPSPVISVESIPERFSMFTEKPFALFLGRVHPHKNVHLLIKWWLEADMPEQWDLVIAGPYDPQYKQMLDQIVRKGKPSSKIHFVGFVDGTEKTFLLSRALWFLLPSQHENFGMAALEAIQHGCPIAISDQVYLSEFMHDQGVILPLTPSAWKTFFESTMFDSIQRERIRKLDRELLLPKFEIEAVSHAWSETLHAMFGQPVPTAID